ncbi:MAG: respiratory nitrate reductase subunit gamma [Deltaproteobacteria bacterium GWC2_42_51]|nr:MAG: respiratory nitrate reductase subunit gamma [Deltaproteobacteria bacterium GWC2_42_51]OGP37739.1 MAG: respiratory nitrate reductase subunit gamma [Deltaproteobacteria bacterium GWD2_42_10]OGQ25000.1 MAG: respiratory nitrate reductase subunit gamma [Deltaproteobacteria bacterium RIFCSPHIGHO2_02_FULL_42_44]OGQ37756.1 MAG: respiratory nitrate reductase subunit gamma [Deltaproteobacteria bacterium RIFCSPLOWO2_02_FULL_42_39]OGQ67220.1 MAG: respiratory nitrate reductase subunit gamma [Deltapr
MNSIFFAYLPYALLMLAIAGTIYRYQTNQYTWSTQSSEFLENRALFFGSFPWHYGIIFVLLIHIVGLIVPQGILAWNSVPIRLYILEISGLAFGFLALFGLLALIYRRLTNSRVKALTSSWDVLLLIVLLIQVVTGLGNAILYRWGSNWYAAAAVPWIWSVFKLNPNVDYVANLPLITKVHIFNAMIFIGLIPFTRLVHFVVINPYKYLWRPYQVVRWYSRTPRTENIIQYK